MDADFWHEMWAQGRTNFHQPQGNAALIRHMPHLHLPKGSRVFVPLCGKTRDIGWLLAQGYEVVGAEINALAIDALLSDLGVTPKTETIGALVHHFAPGLDLFVGDVFELSQDQLGPVDLIYDRAALVALPEHMRETYARLMVHLTDCAPQLLMSFEYDQALMSGPPFSVSGTMIEALYGTDYNLSHLAAEALPGGGFKGNIPATDHVWWLSPHK